MVNGAGYLQLSLDRNPESTGIQTEGLSCSTLGNQSAWNASPKVFIEDIPTKLTIRDSMRTRAGGKHFLSLRFSFLKLVSLPLYQEAIAFGLLEWGTGVLPV